MDSAGGLFRPTHRIWDFLIATTDLVSNSVKKNDNYSCAAFSSKVTHRFRKGFVYCVMFSVQ